MPRNTVGASSTEVTELVFAEKTSHVVAALGSLDLRSAHRTENNCVDPGVPPFKCIHHSRLTASKVPMPVLSTPEAHGMGTFWAGKFLCVYIFRDHVAITVWLWAKSRKWVTFKPTLFSEHLEFFKQFWLVIFKNLLQLGHGNLLSTLVREANYLIKCIVLNLLLEHLAAALDAESMFAVKLNGHLISNPPVELCTLNLIEVADFALFVDLVSGGT